MPHALFSQAHSQILVHVHACVCMHVCVPLHVCVCVCVHALARMHVCVSLCLCGHSKCCDAHSFKLIVPKR